jgi:hypothetical protein
LCFVDGHVMRIDMFECNLLLQSFFLKFFLQEFRDLRLGTFP